MKTREFWKVLAKRWELYAPPARPSKDEMRFYKQYFNQAIKGTKKPRVLVLGATPELRDMLAKTNAEVTVIDINMEMIIAMKEHMKIKTDKEILVKADWLDNPLESNYYDVILGDFVVHNVEYKKHDFFLREIKRLLKKKGYLIMRIALSLKNNRPEPIKVILDRYSKKPLTKAKINNFFEWVLYVFYDHKGNVIRCKDIKKGLSKYENNKKYKPLIKKIYDMLKPFTAQWYRLETKQNLKQLSKYFKIIRWDQKAKDHDFTNSLIVFFMQAK